MGERSSVDCYIDCWEGSYRKLLAPGILGERYARHCYPFARRVLTINNVDDKHEALGLAEAAIARGECDEYIVVADELPLALKRCELRLKDIASLMHFTDFLLVTVMTAKADFVLHVAGDVQLVRPFDWVSGAIAKLEESPQFFVANPEIGDHPGWSEQTALRFEDPYWVSCGFSDQCFLGVTARYAAPIYNQWNLMSYRFPMSTIGRIFEARVDAYMHNNKLLRITDSRVAYEHKPFTEGSMHHFGSRRQRVAHKFLKQAGEIKQGWERRRH